MDAGANDQVWDVAIIGGGAAGLSAALTLARARRSVIVIDGGQPRNAPAHAAHGLLGLEGINPLELLTKGRAEASSYGARIMPADLATTVAAPDGGFSLTLDDRSALRAGQLVIATGVHDDLPDIPGLAERWGQDVVHCPYCHGWEIRDQRIALLATGPMSAMQALLFGQWSERMRFLPNGIDFPVEQLATLRAVGIDVTPGALAELEITDGRLVGVRMRDGVLLEVEALAVPALTRARLDGLDGLGLEVATNAAGLALVADAAGHTSVPGVWAAGNVINPGMQVSEAAANGARVAMTINTELVFARAENALQHGQAEKAGA